MIRQEMIILEDEDIALLLMAIDVTLLFAKDNVKELETKGLNVRELTTELTTLARKLEGA